MTRNRLLRYIQNNLSSTTVTDVMPLKNGIHLREFTRSEKMVSCFRRNDGTWGMCFRKSGLRISYCIHRHPPWQSGLRLSLQLTFKEIVVTILAPIPRPDRKGGLLLIPGLISWNNMHLMPEQWIVPGDLQTDISTGVRFSITCLNSLKLQQVLIYHQFICAAA